MNDLLYTPGADNLSGLVGEVYAVPMADVSTLPALAAATSLKTAAANITLAALKKFARIYFTDETAKVEVKSVGERDGKGRETMLTGRFPAMGADLEDFIRTCQNTPSLLVYRLARNGKLYIIGATQFDKTTTVLSKDIPAYFETGDATTGEKRPDQNGVLLGWKWTSIHGPVEYNGTIDLDAGT